MSQPIVSKPDAVSLIVGNWVLMCRKAGEMQIHNSDGQQVLKPLSLYPLLLLSFQMREKIQFVRHFIYFLLLSITYNLNCTLNNFNTHINLVIHKILKFLLLSIFRLS